MSKTILAEVEGFTPVIDDVVLAVGPVPALVFGKMWRYCQMKNGVCEASQERIANELGLTRPTVNAHVEKLCEAGYLEDITPDVKGKTHKYRDTGKAGLSINFTAFGQPPVKNLYSTSKEILQPPVKNLYTKKEVKKVIKKEKTEGASAGEKITDMPELVLYRSVVSHWPKKFQRQSIVDAISKINARLRRPATPEDLSPFFQAWGKVSGNEWSLVWLTEWAVSGEIPNRGARKTQESALPKFQEKLLAWANEGAD